MSKKPKGATNYDEIERRLKLEVKPKYAPKNPKIPTFPPAAQALAQQLREIIDAGGEQHHMAYAALTRLCVLWVQPGPHTVQVELTSFHEDEPCAARGRMSSNNPQLVNDLMGLLVELFPDGPPGAHGCVL